MSETTTEPLIDPKLEEHVVNFFKEVHQHPELSGEENWTTEKITQELNRLNIPIKDFGLPTGVVADIVGDPQGPTMAIRADIDALPLTEQTDLPYKSKIDGVDHACGHDFHFASLLGAAELLMNEKDKIHGTVRLMFQPGEERHLGARQMVEAGVLKGVDAVFAFHDISLAPVGTVGIRSGRMMASNDNFEITVHGKGTHASIPQMGKDPIVAAASIITTLQTVVSRSVDPADRVVVSVGKIEGGTANNVIPEECMFKGTIRSSSEESRQHARERLAEIAKDVAGAYEETVDIEWDQGPTQIFNNEKLTEVVRNTADKFMTEIPFPDADGDDDFATMEEQVPGVYVIVGNKGNSVPHNPTFVANPDALKYGVKLDEQVALSFLDYLAAGGKLE
jgi:amidohydrolase